MLALPFRAAHLRTPPPVVQRDATPTSGRRRTRDARATERRSAGLGHEPPTLLHALTNLHAFGNDGAASIRVAILRCSVARDAQRTGSTSRTPGSTGTSSGSRLATAHYRQVPRHTATHQA